MVLLPEPVAPSKATVCGLDPHASGPAFKQEIGGALQSTALPEKLRVDEALELFSSFYQRRRSVPELVKRFGLEEKRTAYYGQLSGGQKQRLAIARSLLMDPRILILDDSTSSVDLATEARIQDALRQLMKGRTSFVIAQRISTVLNADQILVLERGRIAARGRHEDLLESSELYAGIYSSQLVDDAQPARATVEA